MKEYSNFSGTSGVSGYEIKDDALIVQFEDGGIYIYNSLVPGKHHVEQMLRLAESGRGLATYINQFVRANYAKKVR